MRPALGHRLKRVRRSQYPGRDADGGAATAAVVAGPVEALVVQTGDGGHGRQRHRRREDSLRVVRMHARLLPLGRGQRSRFLPHRVRDPASAEVVEERGYTEMGDRLVVEAEPRRGRHREVGRPLPSDRG